jgi:ubiquinone/menaquinone biosynthesis C-methylase UbiE
MAERAHPEDLDFHDRLVWQWRWKGRIPLPQIVRSPWKKGLRARYEFCQPYTVGKSVLDIPCGVGWGTSLLRGAHRLVGIDLSEDAIDYAKQHYGEKVKFQVGDMSQLPFADETFDLVLCLEGIEHVPVDIGRRFVRETARVLTPSGNIIVTNPLPDPNRPPNPYHVHEYALDDLDALLKPFFQNEVQEVFDIDGVMIVYYVGRVEKRKYR